MEKRTVLRSKNFGRLQAYGEKMDLKFEGDDKTVERNVNVTSTSNISNKHSSEKSRGCDF